MMVDIPLIIRQLGVQDYQIVWHKMRRFTDERDANSADEIWLVQHPSVFTQGQAGKAEHLLIQSDIPVVHSDRGGQITYHALGQQIMYVLIDIKRYKTLGKELNIRQLVTVLEQTVINTLAEYDLDAYAKIDAPGVYIDGKKISSLGLRIRRGCSFHGVALNIDMDLTPFQFINPCGYAGLQMCQLVDFIAPSSCLVEQVSQKLVQHFVALLGYNSNKIVNH